MESIEAGYICVKKGELKTVIVESDLDDYKKNGWTPVKEDWTKDRVVKQPIDFSEENVISKLREGAYTKK